MQLFFHPVDEDLSPETPDLTEKLHKEPFHPIHLQETCSMQFAKVGIQDLSSQNASAANPRLERSAHEFEASLMAELLKPMQKTDGLTGEDSDAGGDGSGGALQDFASESLARAISERGGFGIADRILQQLNPAAKSVLPRAGTGSARGTLKVSSLPPI